MIGYYENFPENIHLLETLITTSSRKLLQERLIEVIYCLNQRALSFEDVAIPTIPSCTLIFEWGIADAESFTYIDQVEATKVLGVISKTPLSIMDFFCSIRYYKQVAEKKRPLKFDYYMVRIAFGEKRNVEIRISHERGPRYISPEDLLGFLCLRINDTSSRKILEPA